MRLELELGSPMRVYVSEVLSVNTSHTRAFPAAQREREREREEREAKGERE